MDDNQGAELFQEFPPVSTAAWEEKIKTDLKGADYDKKLIWKTDEGFKVKPYYRSEDLHGLEYLRSLPDEAPYVRGIRKDHNQWIIRQDILTSEIEKTNQLALDAISKGVGAVGLMSKEVTTHKQMNQLLAGIDLSRTGVHFISSRSYPLTLELFIYEINHRGIEGEKIHGSINFDPIGYLLRKGEFYINWAQNLEETEYLLTTIQKRFPHFKAININGHFFQDAGSTLVQELGFSLASANEYLASMTTKGFSVDSLAPYFQLTLGIGPNYFMEIAKLRAARLLWTKMVEQYHPKKIESLKLFIHSTSALWNKTLSDPYVNILRTTTEGMSAALGNADSITIQPFDISFAEPDEFSSRIARNQQLILKEEAYLDKIADPAGGAYYIENLTHSIAFHAWELFKKVEERGGIIKCITKNFLQDEIARSRSQKEMDYAQRITVLIGTNQYPNLLEHLPERTGFPDESTSDIVTPFAKLPRFRAGKAFEEIRLATEQYVKNGNKRPSVFLLTIGNLAMLRARAGFITNFFGCAGYEILDNAGFATIEQGVASALASKAEIVVICSSDEENATVAPEIARQIKNADEKIKILVAGYPKDIIETLRTAGVDDFIHRQSNLLLILRTYQSLFGIM
ncbi:MAG: acyl-CoA mutase large subunit family protein [Bacteroidales bacterium]|jgi:methylmalonyl-CoA mutase|nr:acyl-CoA mutase large subunit family protein [Bacteroidales bacterium]